MFSVYTRLINLAAIDSGTGIHKVENAYTPHLLINIFGLEAFLIDNISTGNTEARRQSNHTYRQANQNSGIASLALTMIRSVHPLKHLNHLKKFLVLNIQ